VAAGFTSHRYSPKLAALRRWLQAQMRRFSSDNPLPIACCYSLNRWVAKIIGIHRPHEASHNPENPHPSERRTAKTRGHAAVTRASHLKALMRFGAGALFLNNKRQLVSRKVWHQLRRHDAGPHIEPISNAIRQSRLEVECYLTY
jgi:hypothetical protein